MLNLEKTLDVSNYYNNPKDIFIRFLFFLFTVLKILDLFRAQISEMDILQLIPGTYLFFLFFFLVFVVFFSNLNFFLSYFLEKTKETGTRGNNRRIIFLQLKYSSFLVSICFQLSFQNLIPLTLDSLNSTGEKTLESLWSFSEIFFLEIFFLFCLSFFSQLSLVFSFWFSLEEKIQNLPQRWKYISFFSFCLAGIVTPSLDPNIQFFLAIIWILFFFSTILFLQKRTSRKNIGFQSLF